jgi:hypothetical protein
MKNLNLIIDDLTNNSYEDPCLKDFYKCCYIDTLDRIFSYGAVPGTCENYLAGKLRNRPSNDNCYTSRGSSVFRFPKVAQLNIVTPPTLSLIVSQFLYL